MGYQRWNERLVSIYSGIARRKQEHYSIIMLDRQEFPVAIDEFLAKVFHGDAVERQRDSEPLSTIRQPGKVIWDVDKSSAVRSQSFYQHRPLRRPEISHAPRKPPKRKPFAVNIRL
jgi:hypothetical protein